MHWYLEVLKKYAVFEGRARRAEYWYYTLFNMIVYFALFGVDLALGFASEETMYYGILSTIYSLAVLLPGLGVTVRRLHDTDKSGWWILIAFIPCIGPFILLFFMVQEGTRGRNQFGPDPIRQTRRRSRQDDYDDDYDDDDDEPVRRRRRPDDDNY